MKKYLRAFIAGINENLSFRGVLILHIINPIITIAILSLIWKALTQQNYLDYFVAITLLIPNFQYYSSISSQFNQSVKKGWDLSFAKPTNFFLTKAFYIAGKHFLPYVFNFAIALLYFIFFSKAKVSFLIAVLSFPFITIIDIAIAYFIASFSYLFYSVWGIRVFIRVSDSVFGGSMFPLYLVKDLSLLSLLPFSAKAFFIVDGILSNYLPLEAYAKLLIWAIVLCVIAYPIHKWGEKRFEAQGG